MSPSLSAAEIAALRKAVDAARDDPGVLPDFFKDFLTEWGAKIPAPKKVRFFKTIIQHAAPYYSSGPSRLAKLFAARDPLQHEALSMRIASSMYASSSSSVTCWPSMHTFLLDPPPPRSLSFCFFSNSRDLVRSSSVGRANFTMNLRIIFPVFAEFVDAPRRPTPLTARHDLNATS